MIRDDNKKRYLGVLPIDGSIAFTVAILGTLFISFILSVFIHDNNTLNWVYAFLSQSFFMGTAYFYTYRACKRDCPDLGKYSLNSFHALGYTKRPKGLLILLSVVLSIYSIFAFLPVSECVNRLFNILGYNQAPSYADYSSSVGVYILGLLGLCVFPAFGEESVLRGTLMRGLRSKGTIYAITMSALMFALMHGSPVQFIHQFLIGLIMAYIVMLTDCLWYSIVFHFTNNFVVITCEFIFEQIGLNLVFPWWVFLIFFVLGLVGVVMTIWLFTRIATANTDFKERRNRLVAEKGKVKGTIQALFDTSDYKYNGYDKRDSFPVMVALFIVLSIWILNTVLGWVQL